MRYYNTGAFFFHKICYYQKEKSDMKGGCQSKRK